MKLKIFLSIIGILFVFCETAGTELSKCDGRGTVRSKHNTDEECKCKANVMGQTCNHCKPNTFDLSQSNPLGCKECFCMGITEQCHLSELPRDEEAIHYSATAFELDQGRLQDNDFLLLPGEFLGNRVLYYGGYLKLVNYFGELQNNIPTQGRDIEIWSNNKNIRLQSDYNKPSTLYNREMALESTVPLSEDSWMLVNGSRISRPEFLMALANITVIKIRKRYPQYYLYPKDVFLNRATYLPAESTAITLEKCECPPEYTGPFCEECSRGYIRRPFGPYLGICEAKSCNGHSKEWDVNTGFCRNCAHNTAGEHCHLCASGYEGDATTGKGCELSSGPPASSLSPSVSSLPSGCYCNFAGSKNNQCNGDCICKENVEGERCDRCKPSTFGLSAENPYGCNKCFCNGITDQCYESSYYVQRISGFGDATTSLRLFNNISKPVDGLKIGYSVPENETQAEFTWALPPIYHGNKLKSYGGYLRIIQEIKTSSYVTINPPAIIEMHGNGICLIMHTQESSFSGILNYTIPLRETGWKVATERYKQATREDFMKVLENIDIIYVQVLTLKKGDAIYMRDISMDEAVTIGSPGLDRTTQIEICECPIGYEGDSCERCSTAHYRDVKNKKVSILGSCERCPCSGEWRDCELSGTGEIMCLCKDGYSGDDCKANKVEWQLSVNIEVEPERQTVEPGGVATMTCTVDFRDADDEADFLDHERPSLDSQVQLEWIREDNDQLPFDSTISDGILTINNVQREDTGVYVCRGLKSDQVEFIWAKSYLHVGIPPKITLNPNDETVDLGDDVSIVCHASGDLPLTIEWTAMYRDLLSSEVDDGHGRLTFIGIATTDVGRYVCNATNKAGTATAVAQVLTTSPKCN